jgi:hypothetical protein
MSGRRRTRGSRRAGRPAPTQVTARLAIPFAGEIAGVWEPDDAERRAAWELYYELVSRVAAVELRREEGLLREALSSLYTLFGTVRDIMRRHGPDVAPPVPPGHVSFGMLAMAVLNRVLRPLLTVWHPRLAGHEALRPADTDPVAYERAWEHAEELREEIAAVRSSLLSLARTLQEVAGVGDLMSLPERTAPGGTPPPEPGTTSDGDGGTPGE